MLKHICAFGRCLCFAWFFAVSVQLGYHWVSNQNRELGTCAGSSPFCGAQLGFYGTTSTVRKGHCQICSNSRCCMKLGDAQSEYVNAQNRCWEVRQQCLRYGGVDILVTKGREETCPLLDGTFRCATHLISSRKIHLQ